MLCTPRLFLLALLWAVALPARAVNACAADGGLVQRTITVTHGVVATLLVTSDSMGHQLGDLRVLPATVLRDASSLLVVGRLDAQLLTTSVDYPAIGDEVRMSTLNFVFGANASDHLAGIADQVVVSGSGFYPSMNSTIQVGATLVRPVVGGSGRFAGATGEAKTEHLQDGSWRHTLMLRLPASSGSQRLKACRRS
jgi:hypothetical protein